MLAGLRKRARLLKTDTYALWLACRDPRTPWLARIVAGLVLAYALSPIDLIPDAIPVLGLLDDLVLVPLGLSLALRLVPAQVMAESRVRAEVATRHLERNLAAGAAIVLVWLVSGLLLASWLWRTLSGLGFAHP